jgi:hypothetical protein
VSDIVTNVGTTASRVVTEIADVIADESSPEPVAVITVVSVSVLLSRK